MQSEGGVGLCPGPGRGLVEPSAAHPMQTWEAWPTAGAGCILIVLFILLPVLQVETPQGHGAEKWQAQGPAQAASGSPPPPGGTTLVGWRLRGEPEEASR